jgi:hypothetical protein
VTEVGLCTQSSSVILTVELCIEYRVALSRDEVIRGGVHVTEAGLWTQLSSVILTAESL